VFEYNEGDEILGYKAPRSNRFYFVTDPNGAFLKQMEQYHEHLKTHPHITRHMFGGYQLMQKLPLLEAEARL
jgi:ADP-dependent phosphofructokinase/glucokinase